MTREKAGMEDRLDSLVTTVEVKLSCPASVSLLDKVGGQWTSPPRPSFRCQDTQRSSGWGVGRVPGSWPHQRDDALPHHTDLVSDELDEGLHLFAGKTSSLKQASSLSSVHPSLETACSSSTACWLPRSTSRVDSGYGLSQAAGEPGSLAHGHDQDQVQLCLMATRMSS